MPSRLKREGRRLQVQAQDLYDVVAAHIRRVRHDRNRAVQVRRTAGAAEWRDEVAIMLVHQPDGILASTLLTLRWLADRGIAPIVVSNLALSADDRARLVALTVQVVERPNLGYDFGGYREGVLGLQDAGITPAALYLFNDSVWFPLRVAEEVVDKARHSRADLWGIVLNRNAKAGDYLQTYFLRFGPRVLASGAFRRYWRGLPLYNRRHLVIRRLEWRLAGHFAKAGFTIGQLLRRQDLTDLLLGLPDTAFFEVLHYLAERGEAEACSLHAEAATSHDPVELRSRAEAAIRSGRLQRSLLYAHPGLLSQLGLPVLKKSRTPRGRVQRDWLRRLGLDADIQPEIAAEIVAWDDRPGPDG